MPSSFINKTRNDEFFDSSDIKKKWLNVKYSYTPDLDMLDIYAPNNLEGPFPVVICVSGGGWYFGNKSLINLKYMFKSCLERGYIFASMACTSSRIKKFPFQIFQIKTVIRYLRANCEKYNIDPTKIALWSSSSGAHLSLLTAFTCGDDYFDNPILGYEEYDTSIQAIIDIYGPTQLDLLEEHLKTLHLEVSDVYKTIDSPEGFFLGNDLRNIPEVVKLASPITHIKKNCPPILIQHGTRDLCVPIIQSYNLVAELLRKVDNSKVEYEWYDGFEHSEKFFKDVDNCLHILDFLDKHLNYIK